MSIANRIALVRRYLPAGIEVWGVRGRTGDYISAKATNGASKYLFTYLFVSAGSPFSPRQAAVNFAARLGA